jgi:hypothetical protein
VVAVLPARKTNPFAPVTTVPFPHGISRPPFNFLWVTSCIFPPYGCRSTTQPKLTLHTNVREDEAMFGWGHDGAQYQRTFPNREIVIALGELGGLVIRDDLANRTPAAHPEIEPRLI